jgi:ankyrin repeat protein
MPPTASARKKKVPVATPEERIEGFNPRPSGTSRPPATSARTARSSARRRLALMEPSLLTEELQYPESSGSSGSSSGSSAALSPFQSVKKENMPKFQNKAINDMIQYIIENKEDKLQQIIKKGLYETMIANLNQANTKHTKGIHPVMLIMQFANPHIMEGVLDDGLQESLNVMDKKGNNVLHYAFQNKQITDYRFLFDAYPGLSDLIMQPNKEGITPVMYLLQYGNSYETILSILNPLKMDAYMSLDKYNNTFYHYALQNNMLQIVDMLGLIYFLNSKHIANYINSQNAKKETPLIKAVQYIIYRRSHDLTQMDQAFRNLNPSMPIKNTKESVVDKEVKLLNTILLDTKETYYVKDASEKTAFHYLNDYIQEKKNNTDDWKDIGEIMAQYYNNFPNEWTQLKTELKTLPPSIANSTAGGGKRKRVKAVPKPSGQVAAAKQAKPTGQVAATKAKPAKPTKTKK